jgi:simple sugar transport system ATP-binding protein
MTSSDGEPLLELKGITKRFGGTVALDSVSWSVRRGEIHCLIGENGSGKSTLIKLVSGVHQPDAGGEIRFEGRAYPRLTPHRSKALGVQVIYQDLSLFPNLTVAENIAIDSLLGSALRAAPLSRMRAQAAEILDNLGHPLPLDAVVASLPVADRQIVAIGRGLAANARLLFMDEPTASLTRHEVERLFSLVRRLQGSGITVVFVSHRLDEIEEIAERVSVLRDGRMVGTYDAAEVDDAKLAELMTGDRIEHQVMARPLDDAEPVLEVRSLARRGEFEDVSFTLHRGEVLGVTGLLGAGRTELALALFGMTPAESGEILLDGQPLRLCSNQDAIRAGIAYVSEDRLTLGLNLPQTIADNISLSVLDRLKGRFGLVADKSRRDHALRWAGDLGIKMSDPSAAAQTLSGGNQQRIVLAKWLSTDPKVLILDSPTVGVDIRNKQGIYGIVRQLAAQGVAILMISDEIPEVYFNADRILHMRGGRITGEYKPGADPIEACEEAVYA